MPEKWFNSLALIPLLAFTGDREGINWKWLAGIAGTMLLLSLTVIGSLVSHTVTDKDKQLEINSKGMSELIKGQAEIKEQMSAINTNQKWMMETAAQRNLVDEEQWKCIRDLQMQFRKIK